MKVYLGSPIDMSLGSPADQFQDLANLVMEAIPNESVIFYNPLTAFINAPAVTERADMKYIIDLNNFAIKNCDISVFAWNNSPSYGVPLEIELMSQLDKPFFIWNRSGRKLGLYLQHAVKAGKGFIFESRSDMVTALNNYSVEEKKAYV